MLKSELTLFKSLSYEGRTIVEGRSGTRQAWGDLAWEGQTDDTIATLPDGRQLADVLISGDIRALSACWIRVGNTGAYGDMIWATAMMCCFVSDKFSSALETAGIGGFQLLPLDVHPKRGDPISGYSLLLPDNFDRDADVRSYPFPYRQSSSLDLSEKAMKALADAGATNVDIESAPTSVRRLLEVR